MPRRELPAHYLPADLPELTEDDKDVFRLLGALFATLSSRRVRNLALIAVATNTQSGYYERKKE